MKKTITTKQIKRRQKIDRLAFTVPLLAFAAVSAHETGRQLWETVLQEETVRVTAAAFLVVVFLAWIVSIPFILLWRAVSSAVKNAMIRNATFQTKEDFDYYREKLTGVAPATISLLMDLKIEDKKDVTALLLKYVQMRAVAMENGYIHVLNPELPGLLPSDKTLLALIAQGRVQPANLAEWKRLAANEAIESGTLMRRDIGLNIIDAAGPFASCCLTGCFLPILLFFCTAFGAYLVVKSGTVDKMDRFIDTAPPYFDVEMVNYFMESPEMVASLALMILIITPMFIIFWLPIAALIRFLVSKTSFGIFPICQRRKKNSLFFGMIS